MSTNSNPTRWLSEGFEVLAADIAAESGTPLTTHCDVLIVGSGYGGAIAADALAGCKKSDGTPLKVWVLERGNEYLTGMFPADLSELPAHLRLKTGGKRGMVGNKDGLLDLRPGADLSVLVANGLGGGSLINAGVMVEPAPGVLEKLPGQLGSELVSGKYFERARRLLGAEEKVNNQWIPNTIERHPAHIEKPLAKFAALQRLAAHASEERATFRAAPVTVAMEDKLNAAGVPLKKCVLCGDCATGCNYGAKDSLDLNLLVTAHNKGARIFTGVTVRKLTHNEGKPWTIEAVFTDDRLRKLHKDTPTLIKAARVILAAGALGSTELLLRSRSDQLQLSTRLGRSFSSNGDMLAFGYGDNKEVNSIAFGEIPGRDRKVGPTITGMIDLRNNTPTGTKPSIVIEEMAVPNGLRRLVEEVTATTDTLHSLGKRDKSPHAYGHPSPDPFAIQPETVGKTSIIAMMGDDGAGGAIELAAQDASEPDGAARIIWPELRDHPLFEQQIKKLTALHKDAKTGARVIANPVWQLLPDDVARLLNNQKGPPLTVHPLGGCAIGANCDDGVVNKLGQVYRAPTPGSIDVYENLVVLDGSIIPRALGINPALTIAAVALHAVEELRDQHWTLQSGQSTPVQRPPRPVYRPAPEPGTARKTEARFVERLSGNVELLEAGGKTRMRFVELTLEYLDKPLLDLVGANAANEDARTLTLDTSKNDAGQFRSRLRVFDADEYKKACQCNRFAQALDDKLDEIAEINEPLSGTLTILRREKSSASQRRQRALIDAWLPNRGWRDMWQGGETALYKWFKRLFPGQDGSNSGPNDDEREPPESTAINDSSLRQKFKDLIALASHAGEVRLFEYELKIGQDTLTGIKRITYGRRSNPWRQLMELELTGFPGLPDSESSKIRPVLKLDTVYLADRRIPLFKLVAQQDQVTAMADLASFLGYFLRLFLGIHIWSFRKPDEPTLREPQRLPGVVPDLPDPRIHFIDVDWLLTPSPVRIRLTHYPRPDTRLPPIIMIHGYSASGTTFAHPAVQPNLASYFHGEKRDVWILDMRTSSGMPTATEPWSFEEVAYADIPAAFDFICRTTGQPKLDVIAHCMGSAMLSMAILSAGRTIDAADIRQREANWIDHFAAARHALPERISHLALTQVGPLVVFSPANILRAYAFSYIQQFLPLDGYRFRVGPDPSLTDQLIDRLLATMPYPEEEFDLENPPWPPWRRTAFTGTRHRMDALYGRDFNLKNITNEILLEQIDDHFGPLSIDTLNQTIEFALYRTITDHRGRNTFISPACLTKNWTFPTLSVHGVDNGLSDVKTLYRMNDILQKTGLKFEMCAVEGYGHQDALIGSGAKKAVFEKINAFFNKPASASTSAHQAIPLLAMVPAAGPVIGRPHFNNGNLTFSVRCGADPILGECHSLAFLPVCLKGGKFALCDSSGSIGPFSAGAMASLATAITPGPITVDGHWLKTTITVDKKWQSAHGILVVLLYNQVTGMAIDDFEQDVPLIVQSSSWRAGLVPFTNVTAGAPGMAVHALTKVLKREAAELEPGLIELKRLRPATNAREIQFALGSCQYPAGMVDRTIAFRSFRQLAELLDGNTETGNPRLALLVGDQVYVDATAGLFDPAAAHDKFEKPHETLFRSKHVRNVLRRLPSEMMLDDHEIDDNWEPSQSGQSSGSDQAALRNGINAYIKYQRGADPLQPVISPRKLWHSFQESEFDFFLLDTRTDRSIRTVTTAKTATIISEDQMRGLEAWITARDTTKLRPAFIASPSVVLPRHWRALDGAGAHALRSDTWDGYPASLYALLAMLCEAEARRIVFVSGDLHLSGVSCITVSRPPNGNDNDNGKSVTMHSVCSSGLYTPFPFANAREADLAVNEAFTFTHNAVTYDCTVSSETVPGDGFALLRAYEDQGNWKLETTFQRDPDVPPVLRSLG